MFGIGGQELILLMLIGLIVLGPERLPRIANQLGTWLGQARRMTRVMKRQLEEELDFNKPQPTIKPPAATREPSQKPRKEPEFTLPRDDDDYSPAHGAGEAGSGVGEHGYDDNKDLADSEAELESMARGDEAGAAKEQVEKKEAS